MALPIPIVVDNFASYYSQLKRLEVEQEKREARRRREEEEVEICGSLLGEEKSSLKCSSKSECLFMRSIGPPGHLTSAASKVSC